MNQGFTDMRKKTDKPDKSSPQEWTAKILTARPYSNESMQVRRRRDGSLLATIPIRRPRYMVPPISWVLPFSSHRRVELDAVGAGVLDMCDGRRTVEGIIEKFAADNKLTFRESQIPVTQFLQQLTQRGLVAIVGAEKDDEDK